MTDRTLIHGLARAMLEAAQSFDDGKEWPAALLWPDPERQWSSAFADLRRRFAQHKIALYTVGHYAPDEGVGPSIWLRCLIEAPNSPGLRGAMPTGTLPVILLPGTSWRALRDGIITIPLDLQMLVEMQYRGDIFRQRKQARDWTVGTFLRDTDQGLGLQVAVDTRTDEAAQRALAALLDLDLESWRDKAIGAEDFNRLLVQDDVRDLLLWIADPDVVQKSSEAARWSAFRDQVKRDFAIDVEQKGSLQTAVERLARRKGNWGRVWNRLSESPQQFRAVCERIRTATRNKQGDLLPGMEEGDALTNPHDNAVAETYLAHALTHLSSLSSREAAEKVIALEYNHRARRDSLWARLDEAPLARALEPLARLAVAVEQNLSGGDLASMASGYAGEGWRVDNALIEAIAAAGTREDIVAQAADALYRPWVDAACRRFRTVFDAAGDAARPSPLAIQPGTIVVFVDGLRMDVAHNIVERLANFGVGATLDWRLSPVPSLTATAKPIVTPVGDSIGGRGKLDSFEPLETSSGRPATADVLRKAMLARGIQVLDKTSIIAPEKQTSIGYAECGNIDHDGHAMGLRLAGHLHTEVARIAEYTASLKAAGWPIVRIVTDHGWLLMPKGFESVSLPPSAVVAKGLRAALLQDNAAPELAFVPWHWDRAVRIAMPIGAQAFRAGEVYAHGGLSPQETVTPDITIGGDIANAAGQPRIGKIAWRRLRLTVELIGDAKEIGVEVRRKERDAATRVDVSFALEDGHARLTVSDEIDEGDPVLVVLVDRQGSVIDARATRVGDRA
ncbi:MAG: BREX-1 system phosphatase PglZ type B [Rhizomicrobium sp.]